MSVKNTLDGSFEVSPGTGITNLTINTLGLVQTQLQSMYTIVGNMCTLYIPSFTAPTSETTPDTILLSIPTNLAPANNQTIRGFSVNDADGTEMSALGLGTGSGTMKLGKDMSDGSIGNFNYTSPISLTRYRYITYPLYTPPNSSGLTDGIIIS